MITITFHIKPDIQVQTVHLNCDGDAVFAGGDTYYDKYGLSEIKSIIPPKQGAPTKLQTQLTEILRLHGYKWDKQHSVASAGVVFKRADGDFWFFGMEGEIMHNPTGPRIGIAVEKPKNQTYQIWEEGFITTGQSGTAQHVGTYNAESFDSAVEQYLNDYPDRKKYYQKSGNIHSIWGCKLFGNEADARKSFG